MRFHLEVPRSALLAMQDRYPPSCAELMSTWWEQLGAACGDLHAVEQPDGSYVIEGSHADGHETAGRLVRELLATS